MRPEAHIPEQIAKHEPTHHEITKNELTNQQNTEIENTDTESTDSKKTESLVFEIVSKLTGFPEEMLELDMDIESDLGIDSIKRVEIISELEKSLPSVSTLTPESMGSLRTLQEICNMWSVPFNMID